MAVTTLSCPACGATLRPTAEIPAGRKIKCPKCNEVFTVGADRAKAAPVMAAIVEDDDEGGAYDFIEKAEQEEPKKKKKKRPEISGPDEDDDDLKARLKGKKGKKSSGSGMSGVPVAPIIAAVIALLIFGGGGYGAYFYFIKMNYNKGTGQEELTAFIPEDATVSFGLNASELSKIPEVSGQIAQISEFLRAAPQAQLVTQVPVALQMGWVDFLDRGVVSARIAAGNAENVVILKSRTSFDQNKLKNALVKEPTRERHNGKTYFRTNDHGFPFLYMPSDRIVILTNLAEERLKKLIDGDGTKPTISADMAAMLKRAEGGHAWVVGGTPDEGALQFFGGPQIQGMAKPEKDGSKGGAFWVTLAGDKVKLNVLGQYVNEQAAKAAKVKTQTEFLSFRTLTLALPRPIQQAVNEFFGSMQVNQTGSNVEVTGQVSSKSLGEAFKAIAAMQQGGGPSIRGIGPGPR